LSGKAAAGRAGRAARRHWSERSEPGATLCVHRSERPGDETPRLAIAPQTSAVSPRGQTFGRPGLRETALG